MSPGPLAKYLVVDGFLAPALLADILGRTLAHRQSFQPTRVRVDEQGVIDPQIRRSLRCTAGLGPFKTPFVAAVHARFAEFCAAAGVPEFAIADTEIELAAHGDGGFYKVHLDTYTQADRADAVTDRMLSLVFYFNVEPQAYSGGELLLHRFGRGEPARVVPCNNRLVVFSSIAPHEVLPVSCPSGEFADYRFAVNCWLHRARS